MLSGSSVIVKHWLKIVDFVCGIIHWLVGLHEKGLGQLVPRKVETSRKPMQENTPAGI